MGHYECRRCDKRYDECTCPTPPPKSYNMSRWTIGDMYINQAGYDPDREDREAERRSWGCSCTCGEKMHAEQGCFEKDGHDTYCSCTGVPPHIKANQHALTIKRLKCKVHPRYGALRKPRSTCEACWELWLQAKKYLPK
jgi:hypothetical protein